MKHYKFTLLLIVLMSMVGTKALAYDIEVENEDGKIICYNYINDGKELEVTYHPDPDYNDYIYTGTINIPEEVVYMNRTRKVTNIGASAFRSCNNLTSVTIPNSVTTIGNHAFEFCISLTSVTIPNSVTTIGNHAFESCISLTSVTIPNSVTTIEEYAFYRCDGLTSITIPNSVTTIGNGAFQGCEGLTSVTIPNSVTTIGRDTFSSCRSLISVTIGNSVTTIGNDAFYNCASLTSVTIPNSVTTIGASAFSYCSDLTSVTIPNSVTTIGRSAFFGCKSLTSVTIPNSVTTIEDDTFYGCDGLTSVTIGNSVTTIGNDAFENCSGLISVTIPNSVTNIGDLAFRYCSSLTSVAIGSSVASIGCEAFNCDNLTTIESDIQEPLKIGSDVFSQNAIKNATLYVPQGTMEKYKATDGWKEFVWVEEKGGSGNTPSTPKKCATPTISYQNGELTFDCETEGAEFVSDITDDDVKKHYEASVKLTATYNISVYAIATGYDNSDIATATLCWIDRDPKTEGISNGVAAVRALPVLVQSEGGTVTIQGIDDDIQVNIYDINGILVGKGISQHGRAQVSTNLKKGAIAIVRIGQNSVKVTVK